MLNHYFKQQEYKYLWSHPLLVIQPRPFISLWAVLSNNSIGTCNIFMERIQ
jgi:hypothetical protein